MLAIYIYHYDFFFTCEKFNAIQKLLAFSLCSGKLFL